jgi:hypothetical protein
MFKNPLFDLPRVWAGEQKVQLALRILAVIEYMLVMIRDLTHEQSQFSQLRIFNQPKLTEKYHADNTKHLNRKNHCAPVKKRRHQIADGGPRQGKKDVQGI